MNNFMIQGKLLYKEQKHQNGSILMLLETGKELKRLKSLVYPVNKVLIRVPARLAKIMNNIAVNDHVEVFGGVLGRVYYSICSEAPIGTVQLVANHIHKCKSDPNIKDKNLANYYRSKFVVTSLVKGIKEPINKTGVNTLFVQIDRPILRDNNLSQQPTAVIPISVSNYMRGRLEKLKPQQYVMLEGAISGVTTKIPVANNPGEFEERLEVSLFATQIINTSLVPEKLFITKRQNFEEALHEQENIEVIND